MRCRLFGPAHTVILVALLMAGGAQADRLRSENQGAETGTPVSPSAGSGLDLSEIRFVKRVTVGGGEPGVESTEEDRERQIEFLNRCLSGIPQGRIIALEISSRVARLDDNGEKLVMQVVTYHVGWERKPYWLEALESDD